jgi:hypothetical protein
VGLARLKEDRGAGAGDAARDRGPSAIDASLSDGSTAPALGWGSDDQSGRGAATEQGETSAWAVATEKW